MGSFYKILFALALITLANAHGRLTVPTPRGKVYGVANWMENAPVLDPTQSQPLHATGINGMDWVCRHANPTPSQMTITAGTVETIEWVITAAHTGDGEIFLSYDVDKQRADMEWFKIANIPATKCEQPPVEGTEKSCGTGTVSAQVTFPSWLKAGRAVLRWNWWGNHNPNLEFFIQCADITINSAVTSHPEGLVTYTIPGVYPVGTRDTAYWRLDNGEWLWGGSLYFMTGTACAMNEITQNFCELTAPGTRGHLSVTGTVHTGGVTIPTVPTPSIAIETTPTTTVLTTSTTNSPHAGHMEECRSCSASDAGCTHPGLVQDSWCASNCRLGNCPSSHCICVAATTTTTTLQTSTCDWFPVSSSECPADNGQNLSECSTNMTEGDLCEADKVLPNGNPNYNVNNCGNYDVFKYSCAVQRSCNFVPISTSNCPSDNGKNLAECTWNMNEGELCEADSVLPNGDTNFNINNCGSYDVFRYICDSNVITTTMQTTQQPAAQTTSCASGQYISKDGCLTNEACQLICQHQNGVLCPLDKCKCLNSVTSSSTKTSQATGTNSGAVNLIGYYGNSGACDASGCTPNFDEIPDAYNVIIMTFLNMNSNHELVFESSSFAPVNLQNLVSEAATWKAKADPWGRKKSLLISIGGQNGHWPSTVSDDEVVSKLRQFMNQYGFDGLDIDFEHTKIQFVEKNIGAFRQLKNEGFILSAAPEASQVPLNAYRPILAELDWVHPQFYNNPPNAVTNPWVPQFENHANWQSPSEMPWWLVTMNTAAALVGMDANARGIAIPATPLAAGSHNVWNLNLLASQIRLGDIRNVATWALGYDKTNGWALANIISSLNNADAQVTVLSSNVQTSSGSSTNCVNEKPDGECEHANRAWNMCATGARGQRWKDQCKKTCQQC